MSAEMLRRAAALMRERAEAAGPSPWVQTMWPREVPGVFSKAIEDTQEFDPEIARCLDVPDSAHIASWHPAVALAVADWLDQHAPDHGPSAGRNECPWIACAALAVARAYLEEQP